MPAAPLSARSSLHESADGNGGIQGGRGIAGAQQAYVCSKRIGLTASERGADFIAFFDATRRHQQNEFRSTKHKGQGMASLEVNPPTASCCNGTGLSQ